MANDNKTANQQPGVKIPDIIGVPAAVMHQACNGIKIYSLDCSDQDVVRVSMVFRAGTSMQSHPFTASSSANLLSEGTAMRTAHQISETLDYYGSFFDVSLDRDYAVLTFACLSKFFPQTLDVVMDMVLEPAFSQHEIDIYRSKRKERLSIERSKIGFRARELFARSLFGEHHPYGTSYPESEYDNLDRENIVNFFRTHYVAGNCFVVCSGRIRESELSMLSEAIGRITAGSPPSNPVFPAVECQSYGFEQREGAVQSAIRIGRVLFTRNHPDFIPMQVVTSVLGGYFGSRLVRNLREEHGYTYGVFAGMVNLQDSGYFAISTEVGAPYTEDAITQIYQEMEILTEKEIPSAELDMVRNIMTGEIMRILDGPFGIADVTIENLQNGLDNSYLDTMLRTIREITPEHVCSIARKYLVPQDFTTVVVGNPPERV